MVGSGKSNKRLRGGNRNVTKGNIEVSMDLTSFYSRIPFMQHLQHLLHNSTSGLEQILTMSSACLWFINREEFVLWLLFVFLPMADKAKCSNLQFISS